MNVDKIVQFVLHDFNITPSLEEIEELEEKISFGTAYLALQTSLKRRLHWALCTCVMATLTLIMQMRTPPLFTHTLCIIFLVGLCVGIRVLQSSR